MIMKHHNFGTIYLLFKFSRYDLRLPFWKKYYQGTVETMPKPDDKLIGWDWINRCHGVLWIFIDMNYWWNTNYWWKICI